MAWPNPDAGKFIMQGLPVGWRQFAMGRGDNGGIKTTLKGFVVKIGWQRPGESGSGSPADGGIHGALADTAGSGSIAPALAAQPDQAKNLSYFSHGNSFSWHRALLQ